MSIYLNEKEKTSTILLNVVKMLENRKILDQENRQKYLSSLTKSLGEKGYSLDVVSNDSKKQKLSIRIKIIRGPLESAKKNTEISSFISSLSENAKSSSNVISMTNIIAILVAKTITSTVVEKIKTIAPNVEVFAEPSFLINIIDFPNIPFKITVLTDEEKAQVLKSFSCNDENFPLNLANDPIVKYYGAKPGQMIRYERKSPSSGSIINYRIVTKKTDPEIDQ